MSDFDRAAAIVLRLEGGETDDPDDPGGHTRFGISATHHPDVDIAALTRPEALAIYRRDYWDALKCDELPWPLAVTAFDINVNQGGGFAARALQRAVGAKVDGIIGPLTVASATHHPDPAWVLTTLTRMRIQRYHARSKAQHINGHLNRAIQVHAAAVRGSH